MKALFFTLICMFSFYSYSQNCGEIEIDGPFCDLDGYSNNIYSALGCGVPTANGINSIIQIIDINNLDHDNSYFFIREVGFFQNLDIINNNTLTVNLYLTNNSSQVPYYANSSGAINIYSGNYSLDFQNNYSRIDLQTISSNSYIYLRPNYDFLVVEFLMEDNKCVHTPSTCNNFFTSGQHTYIVAPNCGATEPTLFADFSGGFLLDAIFEINLDKTPKLEISGPSVKCEGEIITLTANPPGLSYDWSSGEGTRSIFVTDPGTYRVTVQYSGCGVSIGKSVNNFAQVEVPDVILDYGCNSLPNLVIQNFNLDYEYSINGIEFYKTSVFEIDTPGPLSVVARSSDGCLSEPLSLDIIEKDPPTVIDQINFPSCENPMGQIKIIEIKNLLQPYNLEWFENDVAIDFLNPYSIAVEYGRTYLLKIRDSNNCELEKIYEIKSAQKPLFNFIISNLPCSKNGSLEVSPKQGLPPFYLLTATEDLDSTIILIEKDTIIELDPNNYNATIYDQNCKGPILIPDSPRIIMPYYAVDDTTETLTIPLIIQNMGDIWAMQEFLSWDVSKIELDTILINNDLLTSNSITYGRSFCNFSQSYNQSKTTNNTDTLLTMVFKIKDSLNEAVINFDTSRSEWVDSDFNTLSIDHYLSKVSQYNNSLVNNIDFSILNDEFIPVIRYNAAPVCAGQDNFVNVDSNRVKNVRFYNDMSELLYDGLSFNTKDLPSGQNKVSVVIEYESIIDPSFICYYNTNIVINITALPILNVPKQELCVGESMVIASNSPGSTWQSSDNTVININSVGLVNGKSKGKGVITNTDIYGCKVSTDTIEVNPLPIPAIAVDESSGTSNTDLILCSEDMATLTATNGGPNDVSTYLWNTGENSPSVTKQILYDNGNSVVYTVTITDNNGCVNTSNVSLTGLDRPESGFELDYPGISNTPLTHSTFFDLINRSSEGNSGGIVDQFQWSVEPKDLINLGSNQLTNKDLFGITSNSTVDTQRFDIALQVTDSNGCSDTSSETIISIRDDRECTIKLTDITGNEFQNKQFCVNDEIDIAYTITTESNDALDSIIIDIQSTLVNDQYIFDQQGEELSLTFDKAGLYTISATLITELGCKRTVKYFIEVLPRPLVNLIFDDKNEICSGEAFYITLIDSNVDTLTLYYTINNDTYDETIIKGSSIDVSSKFTNGPNVINIDQIQVEGLSNCTSTQSFTPVTVDVRIPLEVEKEGIPTCLSDSTYLITLISNQDAISYTCMPAPLGVETDGNTYYFTLSNILEDYELRFINECGDTVSLSMESPTCCEFSSANVNKEFFIDGMSSSKDTVHTYCEGQNVGIQYLPNQISVTDTLVIDLYSGNNKLITQTLIIENINTLDTELKLAGLSNGTYVLYVYIKSTDCDYIPINVKGIKLTVVSKPAPELILSKDTVCINDNRLVIITKSSMNESILEYSLSGDNGNLYIDSLGGVVYMPSRSGIEYIKVTEININNATCSGYDEKSIFVTEDVSPDKVQIYLYPGDVVGPSEVDTAHCYQYGYNLVIDDKIQDDIRLPNEMDDNIKLSLSERFLYMKGSALIETIKSSDMAPDAYLWLDVYADDGSGCQHDYNCASRSYLNASVIPPDLYRASQQDNDIIRIFPNPATDHINIDMAGDGIGSYQLELFDITNKYMGSWLLTKQETFQRFQIRPNVNTGIYYLKIWSKELSKVLTHKIIINR